MNINDTQQSLLEQHLLLVLEANKQTNLTRITEWKQAELLHIEDSLSGIPELEAAPSGRFADIGSGAGYPGIPLAIVSGREAVLLESITKKASALQGFVKALGLSAQIEVANKRSEEYAHAHPEAFSAVAARAVAELPVLMELAHPLLRQGGILIAYKAQFNKEEQDRVQEVCELLNMTIVSVRRLVLSDDATERTLIALAKEGEASVELPRRNGIAQKRPLG